MSSLLIKNYFYGSTSCNKVLRCNIENNNIVIGTNYNFLAKSLFTSRLDNPIATVIPGTRTSVSIALWKYGK